MKQTRLRIVLLVIAQVLRHALKKHELVRRHAGNRRCTVQIKLKDDSIGRYYEFDAGKVRSTAGIHPGPDLNMIFKDLDTALTFLSPGVSQAEIIHAAKNFRVMVLGPDELGVWFMQLMNLTQTASLTMGTAMPDGTTRFTTNTNGGPLFVYVKDDRIVRMTPIDLDDSDAASWTITARGKQFTPKRRAMINPLIPLGNATRRIVASQATCASAGMRRLTWLATRSGASGRFMGQAPLPCGTARIINGETSATTCPHC
jgi:hypothetical protein